MINTEPAPETLSTRAAALFVAYREGNDAAMADLVGLLTPILWHTARSARLDQHAAEDVVQSTWLAFVRNTESIAAPAAVLQWLVVTTRREAWRICRIQDRAIPQEFDGDEIVTQPKDAPDETAIRNSGNALLWQHLERLPERCRRLLRVVAFADRPDYHAVALALGMPMGSIGPTRGRCLAKLRAQLDADPGWELS